MNSLFTDELVQGGFDLCYAAAHGEMAILQALDLERNGGECPVCRMQWRKVVLKNAFADFTYYQPACKCFHECDRCSVPPLLDPKTKELRRAGIPRFMVVERLLGIPYCTHCHPYGIEQKVEKRRSRKRFGELSGKDAAAGEVEEKEET